ncbi:MAG: MBL fold metallo-hydrolase [Rhodospirillaceae bacterium]
MVFSVTFWGVRGTIPCPMASHMQFGGNTSCVEVRAGAHHIIFDAGTGLRLLGKRLLEDQTKRATLLLSHTHLDHISGFPFFGPAFQPGFQFNVLAGHLNGATNIRSVLARQMEGPLFPIPLQTLGCSLEFEDFAPGEGFSLDEGVTVRTTPLNHPDGATGYRLARGGRSVAYITDTEHVPGRLDDNILELVEGVDLLLYDCTFTDDEYLSRVGWGHSTWQEGVRLARAAGVGRLVLFHHEPDHDDLTMARIEAEACAALPGTFAAREGMTVVLEENDN